MGRVAALGCCVCRRLGFSSTPAEVHHIREGQGRQRASDFETIPLCFTHHRGEDGIHTIGTKAWHRRFWSERELLSDVLEELGLSPGDSASPGR